MAQVHLRGVRKTYDNKVAVIHGIDMEIADGEFIVIVGPSGCGKSTLLRMVAGLETITGGEIVIGDRVVNRLEPKDRDIAMVFQNYALYPHMSVFDNMAYGLKIRGLARSDIDARVKRAGEILELGPLLQRKPRQLSGGQRQRVAVGRAIVRQPAVFLFDEPLSNLDAKLRVQTRAEITKLQHTLGTTSVYVTHDQIEAMTMGHRISVMRDGKIQQVGTPRDVYERPANVFVAQFIGTPPMNLLRSAAGGGTLRTSSFTLPLKRAASGDVIIGIRPEHLTRDDSGPIRATVDLVEPIGHESIVYATAGSEKLVAIFDPHNAPRTGETVPLAVDVDRIHLFDAESEIALSPRVR